LSTIQALNPTSPKKSCVPFFYSLLEAAIVALFVIDLVIIVVLGVK
jgi:hypothetical protein